jgi:hypothetical protein
MKKNDNHYSLENFRVCKKVWNYLEKFTFLSIALNFSGWNFFIYSSISDLLSVYTIII